jgi:hypothetical protein
MRHGRVHIAIHAAGDQGRHALPLGTSSWLAQRLGRAAVPSIQAGLRAARNSAKTTINETAITRAALIC